MSTGSERRRARAMREGEIVPLRPVPEVIWHDLESGSAATDLPLWEDLADSVEGPILELGCGTGRVGLHLAKAGNEVIGIDRSAALVAAFNENAAARELNAQALVADACRLQIRRAFQLLIAPQQFIQIVGNASDRLAVYRAAADHLAAGGRAVFAIVEDGAWTKVQGEAAADPLPDIREAHTWVFSSHALGVKETGRGVAIQRLRETVSPRGERSAEHHSDLLDALDAPRLEEEAALSGLTPVERREIPPDEGHAPSVAVVLEKR